MKRTRRFPQLVVDAVESRRRLDEPSYRLEHGLALLFTTAGARGRRLQDVLHGIPLGHPLHPALTDVPLGAWGAALVLDVVDAVSPQPPGWRAASELATGLGVLGGFGAVLTGLTDWQHTHDRARRSGLVHGVLSSAALGLQVLSWVDRRNGRDGRAHRVGALGYGLVTASSFLGGNLVFRHRIGVDQGDRPPPSHGFVSVLPATELEEGSFREVDYDGASVVLVRQDDGIAAVGGLCSHLAAPLAQGWLHRGDLVCPWHGSRFDLTTGCATAGPATAPLARYDVRVAEGQIEVRPADPVLVTSLPGATTGALR